MNHHQMKGFSGPYDFDKSKSLNELESVDWGEPTYESHLVTTCHQLRQKPLSEFTTEDLRLMIGQNVGLPFLIPLALERLETEPLSEGDFYPGDLLASVLRCDKSFWLNAPRYSQRIRRVVDQVKEFLPLYDENNRQTILEVLKDAPASLLTD